MDKSLTLEEISNQIQQVLAAVLVVTANKKVLGLKEAAIHTGLSESYIYKLTSLQEIPHSKPRGKMLSFSRDELDDWLLQNPIKSNSQIKQEAQNYARGQG